MHIVLAEKMKESAMAVLPIGAIILILHFFVVPLPGMTLPMMLTGMFMLFLGMSLFSIGVDMAMMPIGQHVGSALIASRNLPLIVGVLFAFGFVVTIAEPDLSVLARQVGLHPRYDPAGRDQRGRGAFSGSGRPAHPVSLAAEPPAGHCLPDRFHHRRILQ